MNETRNDQELVEAVRSGDRAAFAPLFERWADRCYDVARRILHDDGRAAEVTQEVFTMAWQRLDTLRDPAAFGGWVLRSARNGALNRIRNEQRAVPTDQDDPALRDRPTAGSVEGQAEALDQQELVWAAAAALGDRDASVLDLHLRHDLSVPEIAEELGVTTNNAHQLLFRMKQRLATGIRAYVLVRGGDPSCVALRAELDGASISRFGPEAVQVIGAHVKRCDDCDRRQAALLAPEAMFAAAPIVLLAPLLKAQVASGLEAAGVPIGASAAGAVAGGSGPAGAGAPAGPSVPGGSGRTRALAVGAIIVVVLAIVAVVAVTRGGSDDGTRVASSSSTTTVAGGFGGGSEDPTTSTTDRTTDRTTTTDGTPTTIPVPGGDIEGSWVADASAILGANTANVGGPAGLRCTGPITMTFRPDGTFTRGGAVSCSVGGMTANGAVDSSGRYRVNGDQLEVISSTSNGTMAMGAATVPLPDSFGRGTPTYEISGTTLTITFTDASVGTVTQTYRRA